MEKADVTTTVQVPESFTDVLYIANRRHVPPEIKRLLKEKRLSFLTLQIDQFPRIAHRLDLIGTVIVDANDPDVSQQQKIGDIIESLEMKDISAILIGDRMRRPATNVTSNATAESLSVEELWARISINLAHRGNGSVPAAGSAIPPGSQQEARDNELAEQLRMTGTLVDNLAEQLRMAGFVQRDFLPTQLPDSDEVRWATTFLPAEWVSGDIYDIARVDEQHIGFYVADVVGHAMPAALLTIFLKQALVMRETIGNNYRIFSPAEVMKNLNVRVTGQKFSGYQFATCCYCLLNIKTLQLTYARAGHPYPILIRGRQEPQHLEIRGSLLGIFEQAEYTQQTVQLQSGDKLLLYSDGAESIIGSFDESTGFRFSEEFRNIKDLPIVKLMDRFNALAKNRKLNPSEVDDITAVGLEIL